MTRAKKDELVVFCNRVEVIILRIVTTEMIIQNVAINTIMVAVVSLLIKRNTTNNKNRKLRKAAIL